ncbi:Acyltransferase [Aphelenchoides besseyi]|nr:Acyltransferase [Aphelenchoides besseyi]
MGISKSDLLSKPEICRTKTTENIRLDLQGLRGISILLVLLFHLWPSHFPAGYLGVDVFFVLSGYLMTMFMDRIDVLTIGSALDFYFRRLKRIVPIFAGVMGVVLFISMFMSSAFELHFLFRDTVPAVLFCSNVRSLRYAGYFDKSAKYSLFLHSWSIAVEMQYYLCVPPLFALIKQLNRLHWTLSRFLVLAMIAVSGCFQMIGTENSEDKHMLLISRLWQFAVGYFAFDLRSWHTRQSPWSKSVQKSVDSVVFMIFGLLTFVSDYPVAVRIGITLLAIYSVYLVHWPIFTAHRYLRPLAYKHVQEINLEIALGFCVEHLAKPILSRIKTWKKLLFLVAALYLFIANCLVYVQQNSRYEKPTIPKENAEPLLLKLWNERNITHWTKPEVANYNFQLLAITDHLKCERNDEIKLKNGQTAISMLDAKGACVEKGTGNKTVVIFGNSHKFWKRFANCQLHDCLSN